MDYIELYVLKYKGEIKGYRFYAYVDDSEEQYDFQTETPDLYSLCVDTLNLTEVGRYLMTQDEIDGKCKPEVLTDIRVIRELLEQVKYYNRMREERG